MATRCHVRRRDQIPSYGVCRAHRYVQTFDMCLEIQKATPEKKHVDCSVNDIAGRKVMHDPMAMRPFLGYNFGEYLQHWLDQDKPGRHMPRIFHVNWFRLDSQGKFAWPGFGENIRVIDWMCRRLDGEDIAVESPIGLLPKKGKSPTRAHHPL